MTLDQIQKNIAEKIQSHFEEVIVERKEYYLANEKPKAEEADSIITKFCGINSAISFASNILPPPAGLITIIPEIGITMSNHSKMVYDLCLAQGKEEHITKELLLTLTFQLAGGAFVVGFVEKQATRLVVNKVSPKLMERICEALGIKVCGNVAKSSVAKFIPVLGAAAFSAWATYTTYSIGKESVEILNGSIENTNVEVTEIKLIDRENATTDLEIEEEKIYVLLNLMKADDDLDDNEQKFISDIIDSIDFGFVTKGKLSLQLHTSRKHDIDFGILNKMNKTEKETLFIDMITLSKRDGKVKLKELEYILEVSKKIGFSDKEVFLLLGNDFFVASIFLSENCKVVDDAIVCHNNDRTKKVVLYTNNRVFFYENDNFIAKGSYSEGGRNVRLDSGGNHKSDNVFDNLMSIF